jgi:Copine
MHLQDRGLVSFDPDNHHFASVEGLLNAYGAVLRNTHLSGPRTFAPAIQKATALVAASGGMLHVLVILTCGAVRTS